MRQVTVSLEVTELIYATVPPQSHFDNYIQHTKHLFMRQVMVLPKVTEFIFNKTTVPPQS